MSVPVWTHYKLDPNMHVCAIQRHANVMCTIYIVAPDSIVENSIFSNIPIQMKVNPVNTLIWEDGGGEERWPRKTGKGGAGYVWMWTGRGARRRIRLPPPPSCGSRLQTVGNLQRALRGRSSASEAVGQRPLTAGALTERKKADWGTEAARLGCFLR